MATYFGITPESLLSGLRRTDSKNPHTTCRGVTINGRPCRRSLAAAVRALNSNRPEDDQASVVAILEDDEVGSAITAFFCWQHKDQADAYHAGRAKRLEVRSRGSLEDMLSSIGLQDATDLRKAIRKPTKRSREWPKQVTGLQEPRAHVGQHAIQQTPDSRSLEKSLQSASTAQPAPAVHGMCRKKSSVMDNRIILGCLLACRRYPDEQQPTRLHQREPVSRNPTAQLPRSYHSRSSHLRNDSKMSGQSRELPIRGGSEPTVPTFAQPIAQPQHPHKSSMQPQPQLARKPIARQVGARDSSSTAKDSIGAMSAPSHGDVAAASVVIPKDASLMLASSLMAEMSKISQDTREGYIYMYRLDEPHADVPGCDDGESLLTAPPTRKSSGRGGTLPPLDTILLKIGCTKNLIGRLHQWGQQCGYQPRLVRYYSGSESRSGSKVRHLHRVERLIHMELAEKNIRVRCQPCGKEHREWFEARGREGVREVDRVIRKWIDWSQSQP